MIQSSLAREDVWEDGRPLPLEHSKGTVLLAEDDDDSRRLLSAALRRDGYEVLEARDGVELLGCIECAARTSGRRGGFSVIVADNQMPDLTGLDVLAALGCAGLNVPFILMTAYADPEIREEARVLGVTAFLEKPFALGDLKGMLGKVLQAGA